MIDTTRPLVGPSRQVLEAVRNIFRRHDRAAILLHGYPGVGKSHILDLIALELTRSQFAIEMINGQSVSIDLVRQWRERGAVGNLFSEWTVKRIDELDCASPAARMELLSYGDYLPRKTAVLATTNDYAKIRTDGNRRFERRFKVLEVAAPTMDEAVGYLIEHFSLPKATAHDICMSSIPDGCLPTEGVNMALAIDTAQTYLDVRSEVLVA